MVDGTDDTSGGVATEEQDVRKILTIIGAFAALALAVPAAASARDCGAYSTTDEGATIATDAYYAATCTFAEAAARRFYSVQGVPRHLNVLGTGLTYERRRSGSGYVYWLYDGSRRGRYASVIISEISSSVSSAPVIPYPGRGYPVVCTDGWISNSGGIQGACSHHGGVG
jgi:hypothetical protein